MRIKFNYIECRSMNPYANTYTSESLQFGSVNIYFYLSLCVSVSHSVYIWWHFRILRILSFTIFFLRIIKILRTNMICLDYISYNAHFTSTTASFFFVVVSNSCPSFDEIFVLPEKKIINVNYIQILFILTL